MTNWICSNADSKVNHMIVWRHWTQLRMAVYQQSHWPSAPENWPTSRSFLFHRDKLHSALSPLKSLHISLLLTLFVLLCGCSYDIEPYGSAGWAWQIPGTLSCCAHAAKLFPRGTWNQAGALLSKCHHKDLQQWQLRCNSIKKRNK